MSNAVAPGANRTDVRSSGRNTQSFRGVVLCAGRADRNGSPSLGQSGDAERVQVRPLNEKASPGNYAHGTRMAIALRPRLQFSAVMPSERVVPAATAATNDPVGIREAYEQHHEAVRGLARRLVGDFAAAEELVQETFVAMPGAMRRFRGETTLRALLLGICANHAKHHVRAAARRRAALARLSRETQDDRPSGPESVAMRAELREALQRALDTLSYEHRVVLVLCEVEERTAREAADILAIPEATVRTRLFHARQRLRRAFGEEEEA